ncbi:(d)CMP kinase [Brachyspira aalborgi]|uniref:Cytidylate kinase n=1 Tax=Brachyspira aalborgi TaxID=29522 RepID=A0ABY3K6B6_9SPIR|nr:(d)CMP kinase [Brachyspira aalborgi]TXJ31067.1 (d)CMP kinase [Brachyspira aalborgi]TXJ40213.1 (d)CMP kinase [Brachyspira aalborgi]CCY74910.1 30S ribosomal protein S1 [Brachyspira sp. CAG:700]
MSSSYKIITIDGPSGAGKSTVAKLIADKLGFKYLDTGAMYRAVTLYMIENQVDIKNEEEVINALNKLNIGFDSNYRIYLDSQDITEDIRKEKVVKFVSEVSAISSVRRKMVDLQRDIAKEGNYILDGRDAGSVVFPNADYKFYLEASLEERAKRRYKEELSKEVDISFEEVKESIKKRDKYDSNRKDSPLVVPENAIIIDTTNMTIDEVAEEITDIFLNKKTISIFDINSDNLRNREGIMEDNNLSNEQERNEFLKAVEEFGEGDNNNSYKVGNIVKGKIEKFDDSDVFINLNYKVEGKINRSEFEREPYIGEELEALIDSVDNDNGYFILSKAKLDKRRAQFVIEDAIKNNKSVKGIVKEVIKGGFNISIMGYQAFCPFSQIEINKGIKDEEHIGKEYDFKIIKKKGKDIVVSRRAYQEEKQNSNIETFLNNLKEGDIINGKVKNIERYGAFIGITEGLDGFLYRENMSWAKIINPKDIITRGEERALKVLSIDREKHRVDLGLKQLENDSWVQFIEEYHVGDIIKGEVTNIKKFGAFVKVYDDVEGLIHISDLSWNSHVNSPSDFVKKGAYLECKILAIDVPERKLTLGLKQAQENPWDTVSRDFPVKSIVKCKPKRVLKNFAVFELPNGLEGICDIGDFDWINSIVNIKDYIKENEDIDMVILSIDRDKQRIKLSHKHLKESPWRVFEKEHPVGSVVDGIVKAIVESGAVVSLENNLEGFMHISQIDLPKGANLEEALKIGETYPFVVREVNQGKHRISLSRKDYMEAQTKKETQNYISKEEPTSLTYNPFDNINN